jgi:hypothetical protein
VLGNVADLFESDLNLPPGNHDSVGGCRRRNSPANRPSEVNSLPEVRFAL